jgi:AcrR family transcriptional regulator
MLCVKSGLRPGFSRRNRLETRVVARAKKPKPEPSEAKRRGAVSKLERRHHILTASRDVFAKRGYHQSTIDDIVEQAGVARGTFYLYFEDKRAVFSDLMDRFFTSITMAINRIDVTAGAPPVAEQVHANIRAIVGLCLSERALTKILLSDAHGVDPAFDRKLGTFYDAVVQLLTESLKEGQALGIVSDGEPRVMAYMTVGALKELLYQAVTLGLAEESADVLTQQISEFLHSGYLTVPVAKKRR